MNNLGATSFIQGAVLIGNGSNAVTTKAIDTTPTLNSDNLITSGGVYSHLGNLPLNTESTILDNVTPDVNMRLRIDKFIVSFTYKYQVYNPVKVSYSGSTSKIPEFRFNDLPDGYIIFMFYNNTPYKIKFTFYFLPEDIAFTELISNQRYTSSDFSVTVNTESSICLQGYVR